MKSNARSSQLGICGSSCLNFRISVICFIENLLDCSHEIHGFEDATQAEKFAVLNLGSL